MSVNSSLQNSSFNNKKNLQHEGAKLVRNGCSNGSLSENEVAHLYNDWTPNKLKERGLHLLDFMEER
jgi:hypothetical protein